MTTVTNAEIRSRVRKSIAKVPKMNVVKPSDFVSSGRYLLNDGRLAKRVSSVTDGSDSLVNLPRYTVVALRTAHAYVRIVNPSALMEENDQETERAIARSCTFLNGFYAGADKLLDRTSCQRVDVHGERIHFVKLSPMHTPISSADVQELAGLLPQLMALAHKLAGEIYDNGVIPELRMGIDVGPCIAWDDGDADAAEPVFLGSPANHAAKITAGENAGLFLSERAIGLIPPELQHPVREFGGTVASYRGGDLLELIRNQQIAQMSADSYYQYIQEAVTVAKAAIRGSSLPDVNLVNFRFRTFPPPLKNLKFSGLSPSNSVRMTMAVLFADVCGFTSFVDECLKQGHPERAVRYLWVLRREMNAVLKQDFEAKKVRFIGDCVQGVLAEGSDRKIHEAQTIHQSTLLAAALHRSVRICEEELGGADRLGLSIGVELGETPLSRVGLRGKRSVRLSCGITCRKAEKEQGLCSVGEVRFGPIASRYTAPGLQDLAKDNGNFSIANRMMVERATLHGVGRVGMTAATTSRASAHLPERKQPHDPIF